MSRPYLEMDVVQRWIWMGGEWPIKPKADIEWECRQLWAEAEDIYRFEQRIFEPFINIQHDPVFVDSIKEFDKLLKATWDQYRIPITFTIRTPR